MTTPDLATIIRRISADLEAGLPLEQAKNNACGTTQHNELLQQSRLTKVRRNTGKTQNTANLTIEHRRQHEKAQQHDSTLKHRWKKWRWNHSQEGKRYRHGLYKLTIAWSYIHTLGADPSDVLALVADAIDYDTQATQARATAEAGPRVSSRILAALPLIGMAGAGSMGANPWTFYFSSILGGIDLAFGLMLIFAGYLMSRHMLSKARDVGKQDYDIAFAMTLIQAGLESGASIPGTLEALGTSMDIPQLTQCAHQLIRGQSWWDAWSRVPADFLPIASELEAAWKEGRSPTQLMHYGAQNERRRIQTAIDTAHAQLSVRLMLPLGACHLPAFIVLGVVPVIVHLATRI